MATSRLQRYVSRELGKFMSEFLIYENKRYDWLDGKELDFYMPEINVAIEVQGEQHFTFVPHFHKNHDGYIKRIQSDRMKRERCLSFGIDLHEVCTELDADILISTLFQKYHEMPEKPTGNMPAQHVLTRIGSKHANSYAKQIKRLLTKETNNHTNVTMRANKMIAKLIRRCREEGIEVIDQTILNHYSNHKSDIDERIINQNNKHEALISGGQ